MLGTTDGRPSPVPGPVRGDGNDVPAPRKRGTRGNGRPGKVLTDGPTRVPSHGCRVRGDGVYVLTLRPNTRSPPRPVRRGEFWSDPSYTGLSVLKREFLRVPDFVDFVESLDSRLPCSESSIPDDAPSPTCLWVAQSPRDRSVRGTNGRPDFWGQTPVVRPTR